MEEAVQLSKSGDATGPEHILFMVCEWYERLAQHGIWPWLTGLIPV
jgi:hypothetical protein